MELKKIKEGVFWVGAVDWDRRLFDSLIPLPDGTSYNSFLVRGSEKTALIDTVDPSKSAVLMAALEGVDRIDYIVSNHSEQDHSGTIPLVLEKYKSAKVLASAKGREFLVDLLNIPIERITAVSDGETLQLGGKTLEFISTPWVHWPETISTYLREDKIIFTCDMFGSHLAASSLYVDDEAKVCEAAKRYYAEVMMPFRTTIRKHMEKVEKYAVDIIAPSHGPLHRNVKCILDAHREWVSDDLSNTVVIPYATMHGSTELMVDYLTDALIGLGVKVEKYNLAVTDNGKLAMSVVDAATLVVASPTVLTGAHPAVISAAFLINALRPKLKFASIIGTYGWAGKMVEQVTSTISSLKVEMIEPVIVKGRPKGDDFKKLDDLAAKIAKRHKDNNITK
ncbi:MAG: FprA family A-type flavoprotein [Deltaproteobacteria bacterium]|nr:FprA family A-type flavoprotein [Deltaproteobacteria bacterium]